MVLSLVIMPRMEYSSLVVSFELIIPISYTDWRLVHPDFKDKVWNALMREFEVTNVDQALARSHAEKNFCTKSRYGKWVLRKDILNKFETLEEEITACPDGIDPNHWEQFVLYENTPEVMARKAKNGADKRNRTRGISSNLSTKQLKRTSIAKVMLAQARSSSNSEFKGEMSEMKSSIARVEGVLMDMLKLVTNNGMSNSQPPHGDTTPGTDVGSNSVRRSSQQNLMNMFESANPPEGGVDGSKGHLQSQPLRGILEKRVEANLKFIICREVCKTSIPELAHSMERAIDGLRSRYGVPLGPMDMEIKQRKVVQRKRARPPAESSSHPEEVSQLPGKKRWQWENAIAGAIAGFATVATLHPLDVVHTRFQGRMTLFADALLE
ncbi:hypothetical protein IFM89_006784 [Coptis chinensis]|uniref:Uncharacterized protein n=1 Tax=Coptis chinensis TaxID=261450 RepID=A0A835LZG6_9MAGN|nr:hypothetical protein IFM89_006784 [Coptis chinensis]